MKATASHYEQAVQIYDTAGQHAVYAFADEHEITSWSYCPACEDATPDCDDNSCLVCGSQKPASEGPFKIQTGAPYGWADLKSSVDDGPYETDVYETIEEALAEMEELRLAFPDSGYRVVPAPLQQDFDIYE